MVLCVFSHEREGQQKAQPGVLGWTGNGGPCLAGAEPREAVP